MKTRALFYGVVFLGAVGVLLPTAPLTAQDQERAEPEVFEPGKAPPKKEKVSIETKKLTWREVWRKRRAEKRDFRVYLTRGLLAMEDEQYRTARSEFKKAIHYNPTHPLAYFYRGQAEERQGKIKDAIESYGQAVARDPNLAKARYQLGLAYILQGKAYMAKIELDKLKGLDPALAEELSKAIEGKRALPGPGK